MSARRSLSEELAELERTDPAVKQAAEDYDRAVERILSRAKTTTPGAAKEAKT